MQYERLILEMLTRIAILEEKVANLENSSVEKMQVDTNKTPSISKKYRLLSDYLHNSEKKKLTLTFEEIEQILGFNLPSSAYNHRAFWANTTSHSIALSWLGVGYETVEVDKDKKIVVFERKRIYGE